MAQNRIVLTTLYEKESKNGKKYFVGYLAKTKILLFRDDRATPREGTIAEWTLFVEQKEDRPNGEAKR